MDNDRLDCGWCGSAASIEYGICQVCLMEYGLDTDVIRFPLERPDQLTRKRSLRDIEERVTARESSGA